MIRLCAFTLAAAATAALSGCVDRGDEALLLLRNQLPGQGCMISASEDDPFVAAGTIDTASAQAGVGYMMTPLVANTTSTDRATDLQRTIIVQGADVDLSFPSGTLFDATELQQLRDDALTRFRVRFSGSVKPNGGTASFGFELVPSPLLTRIDAKLTGGNDRALVLGQVVIFGEMGGGRIESQEFIYPVTVCRGCLVNDVGACAAIPGGFDAREGSPCNPYQDGVVDCCQSAGGLVCPAVVSSPPQ